MAKLQELQVKYLTSTGIVTTDTKSGILLHAWACGDTAGDKIEIKDGASGIITMLIPSANGNVEWKPPEGTELLFTTDIDVTITTSNNVYLTILYKEIEE